MQSATSITVTRSHDDILDEMVPTLASVFDERARADDDAYFVCLRSFGFAHCKR